MLKVKYKYFCFVEDLTAHVPIDKPQKQNKIYTYGVCGIPGVRHTRRVSNEVRDVRGNNDMFHICQKHVYVSVKYINYERPTHRATFSNTKKGSKSTTHVCF